MEDKLIEYSDKIVEALKSGVDFAGEQAPILIQEVLTYYTVTSSLWVIGSLIFIVLLVYSWWRFFNVLRDDGEEELMMIMSFITVLVSVAPLALFVNSASNLIMVTLAPRLFLIQKLAEIF